MLTVTFICCLARVQKDSLLYGFYTSFLTMFTTSLKPCLAVTVLLASATWDTSVAVMVLPTLLGLPSLRGPLQRLLLATAACGRSMRVVLLVGAHVLTVAQPQALEGCQHTAWRANVCTRAA
jgi:hypothetical protein